MDGGESTAAPSACFLRIYIEIFTFANPTIFTLFFFLL